ncbi:hypothetical protein [Streptomyces violaceusniger]|uniref:Uncharacterized protein n=1 Tax=Streptomyces violaceusniger (strain Tu 4113) TaxID=653045 RepID=G2PHX1_STRV4|nr:hypothetical protein [Streptomyces violaceusniger]AEM88922.1 hypothetical protein Strvi_0147 [Streptomyces violaceusniger Tu 4113]
MAATRRKGSDRYNTIYKAAVQLPLGYLRCRIRGHKWSDEETVDPLTLNESRVWVECERCEAERYQDWTVRGQQKASGILYPRGYLISDLGILETADRNILRAVYLDIVRANSK